MIRLDCLKDNNARLTQWSLSLQPFQFCINHQPGKASSNVDALSRASDGAKQV